MAILSNLTKDENTLKISNKIIDLLLELKETRVLSKDEFLFILDNMGKKELDFLRSLADEVRRIEYGLGVYMRGLIEFSNYCTQSCNYCGIRRHNLDVDRYRLDKETILDCCQEGYRLGYRTFVLQSGEDKYYTDDLIVDIVSSIKKELPDTAITLSIGEKPKDSYQKYFDAGADRYLLRHETASKDLYEHLHPGDMSFDNRMNCLKDLKDIGYQVGCGFMVNSPTQTNEHLVEDLLFISEFQPHMIGIGPYLCHEDTPFNGSESGTIDQTIAMVSLVRLICPEALLPSTTALGTLSNKGREMVLKSGANVVMPNLSPTEHREKYEIYQNKICTGDEAAHCRGCIETRIVFTGYEVDMSIGHHKGE